MFTALSRLCCVSVTALSLVGAATAQQTGCTADAMIVFDGSGSMAETGFNLIDLPRIIEAREAVRDVAPKVAPFRRLGLIIYGPGPTDSCANVDLRFAPRADAAPTLIREIDGLEPTGETPLTDAVAQAAEVLSFRDKPGVVVLVTDGKETCGGAPCQLAARLAADARDLTVHVIGFKVRGRHFDWQDAQGSEEYENAETVARCLADRTGGLYVKAETLDQLTAGLQRTLGCTVIGQGPLGVTRPRL